MTIVNSGQFREVPAEQRLAWHEPAEDSAGYWGLTKDDVEAIVRSPETVIHDPVSGAIGREWHTERRRRGDVTVVVAFPDDRAPIIWSVWIANSILQTPEAALDPHNRGGRGRLHRVEPSRPAATSSREFKRRLMELDRGLQIVSVKNGDKIYSREGEYLGTLWAKSTKSDLLKLQTILTRSGYDV